MSWLFSQALVAILGGHLLGWRTVCVVERDAYATQVLAQRQNDGALKLSQFGLTCAVLTEGLGEALLTWFLADSRAKTYQPRGMAQELTAPGQASGVK